MSYHLEVLNDKEFEEMSKDLLEEELGVQLQIFKKGRDKGIDLRYANNVENEIIVQAKRFYRSSYSTLKTEMKGELTKMQGLSPRPKRYILMTTFDLSVGQVDEMVALMAPFVKNSQDVYSRERIMNLIAKYPEIEKKYYKIWLTSTNVLESILHNGIHGRSEFVKEKILRRASFYVPTQNFDLAVKKLGEHHFLIISGEPGIGKTTISYLLICDLLARGYQLVYVDDQLKDAEDIISRSPDVKQVVFFDDFFGANLSEIIHPRNSESKIISFIERIQSSSNKYLVMTSRTTILNQAKFRFEKFNRSGLGEVSKYELEIKAYAKLDKAKILYNHMFHAGMNAGQYDVFFKSENYLKIINHPNYFPRLIEFITSTNQLKNVPSEKTEEFIFNSLDNPKEIWHYAYEQQLNEEERILLLTLFSLGGYVIPADQLEKAFEARYRYEIEENGFTLKSDGYNQSIRKLLDGFIKSEKKSQNGKIYFSFLNPSVADFIINFLRERWSEVKRIVYSAIYFKQITKYFDIEPIWGSEIEIPQNELPAFYNRFNKMVPSLVASAGDDTEGNISALYILVRYFSDFVPEDRLLSLFQDIDFSTASDASVSEIRFVFNHLDGRASVRKFIHENWERFFISAITVSTDSEDINRFLQMFSDYELSEEDWSTNDRFMSALKDKVNALYSTDDIDLASNRDAISRAYYCDEFGDALDIVESEIADHYSTFLDNCGLAAYFQEFYSKEDYDGERILDRFISRYEKDDDYDPGERASGGPKVENEDTAIRNLFQR
ncbi:hypothetical protein D3H65_06420 [Paraflavitalea soli]|uniref:AAA+ ATPase domain-containing protein n=1 Tax=Paraflavitalea soli TaxID=2315862 RepID=A0A3B7MJ60_9BACT|nr:restriction endonuclease [Paraflavitalea soli]AXY73637.1 hypothetical protein D3H65_06420 [Paraflavitalea soli]